jgi:hypothetical protein
MQLTDFQKSALSSAGFTDREITLYRQKFYNLFNTQPVTGPDLMRNLGGFRDQRDELLVLLKSATVGGAWTEGFTSKEYDSDEPEENVFRDKVLAAIARCEGGR